MTYHLTIGGDIPTFSQDWKGRVLSLAAEPLGPGYNPNILEI